MLQTRQATYGSRNYCRRGKALRILCSACVCVCVCILSYSACNAHASYHIYHTVIRGQPGSTIFFPIFSKTARLSGEKKFIIITIIMFLKG